MTRQEQLAEQIFAEALELPPEGRSAFLDQTCSDAPELRRLVEQLLTGYGRLGNFLNSPAAAHTAPLPAANDRIARHTQLGRYVIVEPLGAGGMGVVYRAHDEKLDRDVAVKVVSPGVLTGSESRGRFHREAIALGKLSHAHIAAIYDVGEQDGVDYIVMECVPGESLASRLTSGPLPLKDATSILLQIAEALEEAHERGIVHRDLKPANVMVTPKGQVKVLDFGIAKLLGFDSSSVVASMTATSGLIGTPLCMSPEQVSERPVDARTDLWSLGVIYYEALTGHSPFAAENSLSVLRAITEQQPAPLKDLRPDLLPQAQQIVSRALEKDPARRYQTAAEIAEAASQLLAQLTSTFHPAHKTATRSNRILASATAVLLLVLAAGLWFYHRASERRWAREDAIPQIRSLFAAPKGVPAFLLLRKAQSYLPSDPQLTQLAAENTQPVTISSSPAGASVAIQDYTTPDGPWLPLGVTPITKKPVPRGYFRWKLSRPGAADFIAAPETDSRLNFALDASQHAPAGMVYNPGGFWGDFVGFIGWLGPYTLPPYFVDRYEVTNRDFQKFVDSGGYENPSFWREKFIQDGREIPWRDAVRQFRDTTERPGPATWVAGHFPEGKADLPVSGVSWFEAAAYAVFAGKQLPAVAQFFQTAPPDLGSFIVPASNISSAGAAAPVGSFKGMGPYGTYDTAGNVREWVSNPVKGDLRFVLGGSWKSPTYMYFTPEAALPFDRSETDGFRCVRNTAPPPAAMLAPIEPVTRDFSKFKPASDDVFHAYTLLYQYPDTPLNAHSDGIIQETVDWREEKVTFDTGYRGERMSAYLFLPKKVRPPFQTVLFFPSARVEFIRDGQDGRALGDLRFVDYVIQSGRAVMYPVYEDTYDRKLNFFLPRGAQSLELTTDWYKDAARSLDYLATRPDIDSTRLAYLGVSMGAADGVPIATLLQNRLKAVVFLDGGYFLDPPPAGGDQADFAPRLKKPVLMVNGRYDYTFSVHDAQDPLFAMLGTPAADKRHVLLDTPHDVEEQRGELTRTVLAWLDHYLGPVSD